VNTNPQHQIRNPKSLWLVRHGESTANLARRRAESENLLTIDFPEREMDVPLSENGVRQSVSLGNWFAENHEKPTVIYSSPYLRTKDTARLITETAKFENVRVFYDERLREREFGIFDRLTWRGSSEKFPEEMAKRAALGKFYYRPPQGESWCDLAFRIRCVWRDIRDDFVDENVMIVTHEAVIRVFRYVLENLTEQEILAIDRAGNVENCAITSYDFWAETRKFVLRRDNFCVA
jgi:broad specificity phosphatase PhoE